MTASPILLVEDNDDDVVFVMRAIEKNAIANEVVGVRDGFAALDWLADARQVPCVILLDIGLPRLGGLDVLRRLRADQRTRRLPVVVLTSSPEEDMVMESYELGADAFLRKPVDAEHFLATMKNVGALPRISQKFA